MPTGKEVAEAYQPLFDYMLQVHGITMLNSEMSELIFKVHEVDDNLTEIFTNYCDVQGCGIPAASGGNCWRETGYWSICSIHSQEHREGKPQPQMKQEAIEREASRLTDGTLPIPPLHERIWQG